MLKLGFVAMLQIFLLILWYAVPHMATVPALIIWSPAILWGCLLGLAIVFVLGCLVLGAAIEYHAYKLKLDIKK